ncbi:lysozyme inhibitor LprI family protein [Novispirillum sp. DQ9]|uniref:lysozyme inhibitor LprI family protein n=1 Tax=Novispirillum sp. DQ9 TaxID=3398612 RepID=UPI003C7E61FA
MRITAAVVLGFLFLFPAVASAASFDCTEAKAPVELLICADPVLSALDERMAEAYAARKATERDAQRAWLRARLDACGIPARGEALTPRGQWAAAPCLVDQYHQRLAALGAKVAAAAPVADGPAVHPLCLPAGLALGDEQAPFTAEDLEACQKGMRHIPVERSEGGAWVAYGMDWGVPTYTAIESVGAMPDGRQAWLVNFNTGGTGVFSSIVAVGPKGVEPVVGGGDRCSGGIVGASLAEDGWRVRFNATPADLAHILGISDLSDGGLPYCAVCCAGEIESRTPADGGEETVIAILPSGEALQDDPTPAERCLAGAIGKDPLPAAEFPAARKRFAACMGR